MANEIRVNSSLTVVKNKLQYQSRPGAFVADMDGTLGPTPGALTVPLGGVDIDLSQLDIPGMCEIKNLENPDDTDSWIMYGVYDPASIGSEFVPLGECLPGESFVLRLSRFLGEQYGTAAGTGTTDTAATLRLKAVGTAVRAYVGAFEK